MGFSSTLSKEYIEDERKALEKSGGKDNDEKQFPHAACIIDVTRCSVAFANAGDLMEGFERVMDGTCQEQFGCRSVVRSELKLLALERSGGKDHDEKQFPHAACIIDVTRPDVFPVSD